MCDTGYLVANLKRRGVLPDSWIPKFYCAVITCTYNLVLEKVNRIYISVVTFESSYSSETCGVPGHYVVVCTCGADCLA